MNKVALKSLIEAFIASSSSRFKLKSKFLIGVFIQGKEYAHASGKSKKEAQQNCAKIALEILKETK